MRGKIWRVGTELVVGSGEGCRCLGGEKSRTAERGAQREAEGGVKRRGREEVIPHATSIKREKGRKERLQGDTRGKRGGQN